ncbi:MAG: hypothetical protein A2049_04465 [Elusimicrobia bacterium GWA2_62_23]|nr:MAG: hypothetical protein A2049_04465 [Elusimicrobia bacterium GWA2_62_23]OGR69846.1 MAG: hypothetical protein A2179_00610 [Elusimicrobia bacterium GWC2_63_65]
MNIMQGLLKGRAAGATLRGLALFAVLLGWAAAASAEVPVKFTYQGNLRQNGFLVNGTRTISFRIYDSSNPVSSTLLWTSPDYSLQVSTGVFRASLEPSVSAAAWQSGSLWLEMTVQGVVMLPREQITASPYAVNSLMLSGKRYTTAAAAPTVPSPATGDLWMDTGSGALMYYSGGWLPTSGTGLPADHAATHAYGGSDPIVNLGAHTVDGYINISSAVNAAWVTGNGVGLHSLNASNLASGTVPDIRLSPNVDLLDADQTAGGRKTFSSSFTVTAAAGLSVPRIRLGDDGVALFQAPAVQYGGVYVSTNIYTPVNIYAAKYYGDGSALLGVVGGDSLGTHVATQTLNMAGFPLTGAGAVTGSSFTASGAGFSGAQLRLADNVLISSEASAALGGGIRFSTHVYSNSDIRAARFIGDISGAWGLNGADNLGTHVATRTLDMNGFGVSGAGHVAASSFSASGTGFHGSGSNLTGLNASAITQGTLYGDRIGNVIVSTHIVDSSLQTDDLADGAVVASKLGAFGCATGDIIQWGGSGWVCGSGAAAGVETDPLSVHNTELQEGTTFYVSSGTATNLNVENTFTAYGIARLKGAPSAEGLTVDASGNVAIGLAAAAARLEVKGAESQSYSLAVGTGTAHHVVVSTAGYTGLGTDSPRARLDVTSPGASGEYIAIFNSGPKVAAWLRNK